MAVVRALVVRDLRRALYNPVGYVFVTLFILLSATAAFWPEAFYHDNLATLDQLNRRMLPLLALFIPALAMNSWAEERRYGTDALLLTLPGTEWSLVLGKYLATLLTFSAALVLSASHLFVLRWLGHPDVGVVSANFLAYWLAAAALIPLAMIGSQVSANAAIAFVAGALLCAVPVALHLVPLALPDMAAVARVLALTPHMEGFYRGALTLDGLIYPPALAFVGLFVNVALLSRRRWPSGAVGRTRHVHALVRMVSAAVVGSMLLVLTSRTTAVIDATAEQIHSLSPSTRQFLATQAGGQRVRLEAFVSPEVPEEYVQQRRQLLNVLEAIATAAGGRIELSIDDTEQYSEGARRARERFGIVPRLVADTSAAGGDQRAVFMGLAFTAGGHEDVIPFLERGLSPEYEIARSIRLVGGQPRKRVGIVDPESHLLGGMDYQSGRALVPWVIAQEIRRQYDVVSVDPSRPIVGRPQGSDSGSVGVDALVVILPARLLQSELDHTMSAISSGVPALLVLDPAPVMDMRLAPAAAMAARLNPYLGAGQAVSYKNTGDIQKALTAIGLRWPPTQVAWDGYRPRQEFAPLPWEVVFVNRGAGNTVAFADDPMTRELKDMVFSYPGALFSSGAGDVEFQPLVSTGTLSGVVSYFDILQPSPAGPVLNRNVRHAAGEEPLTVAARVRRTVNGAHSDVIVVSDLDFVANQFFAMREATPTPAFDNVTFFMNALDTLVGEQSWLALRTPRAKFRTLERIEDQTRGFMERRATEEQAARADADQALQRAAETLQQGIRTIQTRADLDQQSKDVMARSFQETEQRRLDVLKRNIEQARDGRIVASREAMEQGVRRVQLLVRISAVLAPLAPIVLGALSMFLWRRRRLTQRVLATGRVIQ